MTIMWQTGWDSGTKKKTLNKNFKKLNRVWPLETIYQYWFLS